MHPLVDQLLSLSEELACQDYHRGGAVSYFIVLHSADICTAPGVRQSRVCGLQTKLRRKLWNAALHSLTPQLPSAPA